MESISKEKIKRIQGYYLQKYGESIDPTTAMLLNEVQEIKKSSSVKRDMTLEKINNDIELIKNLYKPFLTNQSKIAFLYGLGKFAWTWVAAIAFLLGVLLHHTRESTTSEYRHASSVLNRYPNVVAFEHLIKNGRLVENKRGLFLEIKPATTKLLLGNTYVQDPDRAMNKEASKILIPLSFK